MAIGRRAVMMGGSVVGAAALTLGAVVPNAAARPYGSASSTISDLRAQGYDVTIDKVGAGPLEECVVTNVRNANTAVQTFRRPRLNDRSVNPFYLYAPRTVQVSLRC